MTRKRALSVGIRVVAIAAVAAALWWFIRKMDFGALWESLKTAKVWPLVLAAALNWVCLWGKAACWRVMLAPRFTISTMRLFRYTIAAFAASAVAPARAGEVYRVWTLKRRDGVPPADSAAVAVAEKLLDGVSMLLLVAPVPFLLPGLPAWVVWSILGCAAIAITLFVVLYILSGRTQPEGTAPSLVRQFFAGMHVLRSPKRLVQSIAWLLLVWAADLAAVMSVLYAIDVDIPVAGGLLVLFTLNVAITVPSTPAQVGALEVGALAGLALLHVPEAKGAAFAVLYHALQVIPLIIAGLVLERRTMFGGEAAPAEATPSDDRPQRAA
ncbi:MAG TPA: lysylphosphatidylglycerol synthase transmembrane domain-containing protein [Kofleriaceae bacterium]